MTTAKSHLGRLSLLASSLAIALLSTGAESKEPSSSVASRIAADTPADLFGELFVAVQQSRIFDDGKTFVDATPKRADAAILADFRAGDFRDDAALKAFVLANFDVPGLLPVPESDHGPRLPIERHIAGLWPHLTRDPVAPPPGSSALA
ncbi:hypothetical protein LTR94_033662, partial [Friedmanniomyces endolithicus]